MERFPLEENNAVVTLVSLELWKDSWQYVPVPKCSMADEITLQLQIQMQYNTLYLYLYKKYQRLSSYHKDIHNVGLEKTSRVARFYVKCFPLVVDFMYHCTQYLPMDLVLPYISTLQTGCFPENRNFAQILDKSEFFSFT